MALAKSLLFVSLFTFGAGTAFAGEDSTVEGSLETSPPVLLSEDALASESELSALEEDRDVIYLYPMEVTEYYMIVPNESGEMPG